MKLIGIVLNKQTLLMFCCCNYFSFDGMDGVSSTTLAIYENWYAVTSVYSYWYSNWRKLPERKEGIN